MIEWKKWDHGNPMPTKDFYLVSNGTYVDVAYCEDENNYGYTWWGRDHALRAGVTHYAEINLPVKETDNQ